VRVTASINTPELLGYLVVALGLGVIGCRIAVLFRRRNGASQWGVDPLLWGLLFACSWVVGAILIVIAGRSTRHSLDRVGSQAPPWSGGPPPPSPPRRGPRAAAAAVVVLFGLAGTVGGIVGVAAVAHTDLATLVVETPEPGMVETAIGAGGTEPTQILPGANSGSGITGSGVVPTTPTLYLVPATATNYGVKSTEAAYWEVWWNGTTQAKDVVSLQQHLDDSDANQEVALLAGRNSNPANFDSSGLTFTSLGSFSIPAIPGSSGILWSGVEGGSLPIQFRCVVFSRGAVVALVSTTDYAGSTSSANFDSLATAEYGAMQDATAPLGEALLFNLLLGLGVSLVLAGVIILVGTRFDAVRAVWGNPPVGLVGYGRPFGWPGAPPPPPMGGGPPWGGTPPAVPPPPPPPANLPPAGWFPDPGGGGPGLLRYWDGSRWTDATTQG
jgi:hypothetical protein